MAKHILLKNVRVSFPEVFKQGTYEGEPSGWGAHLILDPKDHKGEIAEIESEIAKVLKDDKLKGWKPTPDKICLKDTVYSKHEGCFSIRAGSRNDPPVVLQPGTQAPIVVNDYENENELRKAEKTSKIYSGCYVTAKISLWPQNKPAPIGKRVNAQLIAIRFEEDGERFGGSHVSESEAVNGFEVADNDAFFDEAA
jgi:hypothetical protein